MAFERILHRWLRMTSRRHIDRTRDRLLSDWIERRAVPDLSLSFDQEKRLVEEEWAGRRSFVYEQQHLAVAFALRAGFNAETASARLNRLIARQSALRMTFHRSAAPEPTSRERILHAARVSGIWTSGLHYHRSSPTASISLQTVSLDHLPTPEGVVAVLAEDIFGPFNTETGPLLRAALIVDRADRHLLLLTLDRLASDWSSVAVIRSELEEQTESATGGGGRSRRQRVPRIDPDSALASAHYWSNVWSQTAPLTTTDLPFSLPDVVVKRRFGCRTRLLPAEAVEALRRASAVDGHRVSTLLLSAVVCVLHHATRKRHLAIWSEFRASEITPQSSMVGAFSTAHILAFNLTHVVSAQTLITEVERAVSATHEHQNIPLDLVWRLQGRSFLHRQSRPSHLSFQHLVFESPRVDSVILETWPLLATDRRRGLQFISFEERDRIGLVATYDTSTLRESAIDDLLDDVALLAADLAHTSLGGPPGELGYGDSDAGRQTAGTTSVVASVFGNHSSGCLLCNRTSNTIRRDGVKRCGRDRVAS